MLSFLNVQPRPELLSGYASAEEIPSKLSTPYQFLSLNDIGIFSYLFGMKDVQVDLSTRITSHEVPGSGTFIGLDGDLEAIWKTFLHRRSNAELQEIATRANGYFPFQKFMTTPYVFQAAHLIYAFQNEWNSWKSHDKLERRQKHGQQIGDIVWESDQYREFTNRSESLLWTKFRDERLGGGYSSIIQNLAFLPFHHVCAGFPLMLYMPYSPSLLPQFKSWWGAKRECLSVRISK